MLTQRRVFFFRATAMAAMLTAMVFFAGTSPLSAGGFGNNIIQFGTHPVESPSPNPSYNSQLLGLSSSAPSISTSTTGFTISALDYTVTNTSGQAITSPTDVIWTFTRDFTTTGPLAAVESISGSLTASTKGGSAAGTITISAAIFPDGSQSAFKNSTIATTDPALSGTYSWHMSNYPLPGLASLPATLESFDFVQLTSDLHITSLAPGASITVNDPYGVTASAVPEPSSLVLFAIPSTMMLAGLAARRWYSRRRCRSDQRAAASLCC
jgi:hypothetical protein